MGQRRNVVRPVALSQATSCEHCDAEGSAVGQAKSSAKPLGPQAAARLTSKFHLTMATLIEAEAEENPDEAKIGQLTEQVETLRAKLHPMGGPGGGQGRGRGQAVRPGRNQATGCDQCEDGS